MIPIAIPTLPETRATTSGKSSVSGSPATWESTTVPFIALVVTSSVCVLVVMLVVVVIGTVA